MWVSALAYLLSRGWSIYREQVPSRFYSDAHRGDFVIGILKGMTVGNIWKPPAQPPVTFPFDAPLTRVTDSIPTTTQTVFPVLDKAGKYFGLLHLNQIRRIIYEKEVGQLVIVEDIAVENVEPLRLDTDLSTVMTTFRAIGIRRIARGGRGIRESPRAVAPTGPARRLQRAAGGDAVAQAVTGAVSCLLARCH